jgi:hypothetical protein
MLKIRHLHHPFRTARHAGLLFRLHGGAIRRGLEGRQHYGKDTRFRLELVEQGFLDRGESTPCDRQVFSRICDAYHAAASVPIPEAYEPTSWWEMLRRANLQRVMKALQMADIDALQRMYGNFFRDPCSDGLVGKSMLLSPTLPRPLVKIHQWAYLSEALSRLDRWKSLTHGMYDLADLRVPKTGNPYGIVLDDVFVSNGAEHQHYGARRVSSILNKDNAVVAEIGGGYGAMAYYLLRDSPRMTYWNFDVPESLALAAYYLIRNFPEKRILLYGEFSIKNVNLSGYDIVLMPLTELSNAPPRFADMIFSAHAMSDLNESALKTYLERVGHLTAKYFLYQGMFSPAKTLQRLIANEYSTILLREEKQYYLHGRSTQDQLQCELLYEVSAANDQTRSHAERSRSISSSS